MILTFVLMTILRSAAIAPAPQMLVPIVGGAAPAAGGTLSWGTLTNGQWTGMTNGEWAALTN